MSSLRVAIDMTASVGRRVGVGVYVLRLVEAMEALAPRDVEIIRFQFPGDWSLRTPHRFWRDQVEIPRQARRLEAGLMHCPGFSAPALSSCPVVLTVLDLIPVLFPQNFSWSSHLYMARWMPFSARFARAVIAPSDASMRDLVRFTRLSRDRVSVIPLGVEPRFRPAADPTVVDRILEEFGVRRPYVLGVSSIEPRKNFPMLLEAFDRSCRDGGMPSATRLVIAGSKDWGTAALEAASRSSRSADRLILTGYVSDEQLLALYQGAELFVFPSSYEGFGFPVLEAMACGTPVIASEVSSIPEVAGEACRLVSPPLTAEAFASAMSELLRDGAARAELSRKGLERAALFTWDATARATLDVYRQAAGLRTP